MSSDDIWSYDASLVDLGYTMVYPSCGHYPLTVEKSGRRSHAERRTLRPNGAKKLHLELGFFGSRSLRENPGAMVVDGGWGRMVENDENIYW